MRRDGRPFQWQPQRGVMGPWGLAECRRIIDRIEANSRTGGDTKLRGMA